MAKFVGIYQLPKSLGLSTGCCGKRFRTNIAGRPTILGLPVIDMDAKPWGPSLMAPLVKHLPQGRGSGISSPGAWVHGEVPWGVIGGLMHGKPMGAWVECVTLEFALPDGSFGHLGAVNRLGAPHGGTVEAYFDGVDEWFHSLATWVGVAIDQDTTHDAPPIETLRTPGAGLTITEVQSDGTVSVPASATRSNFQLGPRSEGLTLGKLRAVIPLANQGVRPTDARLLLRDAWIEHRRGRARKAVIDACTAAELTLAQWWRATRKRTTPPKGFETLGTLLDKKGAPAPSNTKSDLGELRNKAVHENRVPTREQTEVALGIARTILDAVEPLPL